MSLTTPPSRPRLPSPLFHSFLARRCPKISLAGLPIFAVDRVPSPPLSLFLSHSSSCSRLPAFDVNAIPYPPKDNPQPATFRRRGHVNTDTSQRSRAREAGKSRERTRKLNTILLFFFSPFLLLSCLFIVTDIRMLPGRWFPLPSDSPLRFSHPLSPGPLSFTSPSGNTRAFRHRRRRVTRATVGSDITPCASLVD